MATFKIGKVLMKSLFKKPATKMYPVIPNEFQERTRGQVTIEKESCILCGICGRKCPANAIAVDRAAGTWTIERMRCIQCGCCVDECPKKCLDMDRPYTTPDTTKTVDVVEVPKQEKKPAAPAAGAAAPTDGGLKCDKDVCVFCGLCARVCPCDALTVNRADKVWEVSAACVKCGACVEKCPKKCLTL